MEKVIFKSKIISSLRNMLLRPSTFIQIFITILFLVGEYLLFSWFLVISLIGGFISILVIDGFFSPLFSFIGSNFFLLDDESKIIISKLPLRRSNIIPYDRIKNIRILDFGNFLWVQAYVKTAFRRIKKVRLFSTEDKKDREKLKEELSKRFSEVREQKRFFPSIPILNFSNFIIPVVGYLFFTFFIYTRFPQAKIYPKKIDWKPQIIIGEDRNFYTLHSVKFSLPEEFKLVRGDERGLQFKDMGETYNIIVFWEMVSGRDYLIPLIGIKNNYDALKAITYSRLGIIPLYLKCHYLSKFDEVKIYEVKRGRFKGLLLRGWRRGRIVEELYLVDRKGKRNINFICIFRREEDDILKILDLDIE